MYVCIIYLISTLNCKFKIKHLPSHLGRSLWFYTTHIVSVMLSSCQAYLIVRINLPRFYLLYSRHHGDTTFIHLPRFYLHRFNSGRFYPGRFYPGRFYPPRFYPARFYLRRFYPGRLIQYPRRYLDTWIYLGTWINLPG